jgi:hypothetical protein
MNHFGLTDFEIFLKLVAVLLVRKVMSWLELARKARVGDDKAKRVVERLSSQFGMPLIVSGENRCLKLTAGGKELAQFLTRMNSLADEESPAAKLTVLADPLVAQILLPAGTLTEFFSLWGSSASVSLPATDGLDSARKEIMEGRGDFALCFAEPGETVSESEAVASLPWVLLVPKNHRLFGHRGAVSGGQLQDTDRVFLPGVAAGNEGLEAFLAPIPPSGRVQCESVLAMVDAGWLGIIPDLYGHLHQSNGFSKLVIENVAPVQIRLVLPRKGMASLSEPAEAMVGNIRRSCETRFATPTSGEAAMPESVGNLLFSGSVVAAIAEENEAAKA